MTGWTYALCLSFLVRDCAACCIESVLVVKAASEIEAIFTLIEPVLDFLFTKWLFEWTKVRKLTDGVRIELINTSECFFAYCLLVVSKQQSSEFFSLEEVLSMVLGLWHCEQILVNAAWVIRWCIKFQLKACLLRWHNAVHSIISCSWVEGSALHRNSKVTHLLDSIGLLTWTLHNILLLGGRRRLIWWIFKAEFLFGDLSTSLFSFHHLRRGLNHIGVRYCCLRLNTLGRLIGWFFNLDCQIFFINLIWTLHAKANPRFDLKVHGTSMALR